MGLKGQIALVTGASQGIGAAILSRLGQQGATVIGTATTENGAANIGEALAQAGLHGRGLVLDVRDDAQIDAVASLVEKEYGPVSILVNNAGITRDNLAMRMKDEEWDAVIDTNLRAVFRMSRAVMRGMMKARAGRIINISSVVGHAGNPGQANYCAAKAGLGGMTRALARELGSRGITVNCVAPGLIDTEMLSPDIIEHAMPLIPAKRLGMPEEVAATVAFLLSHDAAYITRQVISVNGGMVG